MLEVIGSAQRVACCCYWYSTCSKLTRSTCLPLDGAIPYPCSLDSDSSSSSSSSLILMELNHNSVPQHAHCSVPNDLPLFEHDACCCEIISSYIYIYCIDKETMKIKHRADSVDVMSHHFMWHSKTWEGTSN